MYRFVIVTALICLLGSFIGSAPAQIVLPVKWEVSGNELHGGVYTHVQMDDAVPGEAAWLYAFGTMELEPGVFTPVADRIAFEDGSLLTRAADKGRAADPHTRGGLDAAGRAYLVDSYLWDDGVSFHSRVNLFRVADNGRSLQRLSRWSNPNSVYVAETLLPPVLSHASGGDTTVSIMFGTSYDFGGGDNGYHAYLRHFNLSGLLLDQQVYDLYGMWGVDLTDNAVSSTGEIYFTSADNFDGPDYGSTDLRKVNGWRSVVSEDGAVNLTAVATIPQADGGGTVTVAKRSMDQGTAWRYSATGNPIWMVETPQSMEDVCTTASGHIVGVGGNEYGSGAITVLSVDGDLIQTSHSYDWKGMTSIWPAPDGGLLLAGQLNGQRKVMRIAAGAVEIQADPEPVPSGGGDLEADITVRTGLIHDGPATVQVSARHLPTGAWVMLHEQDVALAAADTLTLNLVSPVSGDFPDGTGELRVRIASNDGRLEFEQTATFVKGSSAVGGIGTSAPRPGRFALAAAHPNPFNAATTLAVTLPRAGELTVTVYDLLGRPVRELHHGPAAAGTLRLALEGHGLASGSYLVQALAGGEVQTRRVTLVK